MPEIRLLSYHPPHPTDVIRFVKSAYLPPRPGAADEDLLHHLILRGHTRILEHTLYVFEARCSRICARIIQGYRVRGYVEENPWRLRRHLDGVVEYLFALYDKRRPRNLDELAHVMADLILESVEPLEYEDVPEQIRDVYHIPRGVEENPLYTMLYVQQLLWAIKDYYAAIGRYMPRDEAWYMLPQALKTRTVFSIDGRELFDSLIPRETCIHAQEEMRILAWRMRAELVEVHPAIFAYTGPRCIMIDMLIRREKCTLEDYLKGRCMLEIPRCPEGVPRDKIVDCVRESMETVKRRREE